jgi:GTP cyclohydrolase II
MGGTARPIVTIGDPISLPTRYGELSFRYIAVDQIEGVLVNSDLTPPSPIPVRIQSSCLFSESLSTIDCDCSNQLQSSLNLIATTGGYVLYLYEEGRGAGLRTKFEAIRLQQTTGADTAAAFASLGMKPEPRNFSVAAQVLVQVLGDSPILLLTNNPSKIELLKKAGVNIVATQPLVIVSNSHVATYLRDKARVLGHIIQSHTHPSRSE